MSEFLAPDLQKLAAYVPGEQPQDKRYIKLNTNENPYYPSERAVKAITEAEVKNLRLYSDPDSKTLIAAIAKNYGVSEKNVVVGNGSDEILAFSFRAFGQNGACFPDVTYGFYKVFADMFGVKKEILPLTAEFKIDASSYFNKNKLVVLANPNAQTGIALSLSDIEKIAANNEKSVVLVDEAYVDFGGESAVGLTKKYKNLVVVQTFSKSRSLAGARVGFAVADEALISDLNRVRNSFNPYNVNRLSAIAASEAMKDKTYFEESVKKVVAVRAYTKAELEKRGFCVLDSRANFLMAKTDKIGGEELYLSLKEKGVLVRHFKDERIKNFVRVSIGTKEDMEIFLKETDEILRRRS